MPPYGPDPVSKEEADEARARAAGQNSEHRDRNEPQSREKKDKDENHKGGRRGKENGKDAGPAEEGEEEETPWWAKWQVMVPVVAGAAILGLVCSALFSENVHKQVVEGSELQSRANSRKWKQGKSLVTDPSMTVTVEKGDTLYSIARDTKVSVEELRSANNLRGDFIKAGTTLFIPDVLEADEVPPLDSTSME